MSIELSKKAQEEAIGSIQTFFDENMEEPIGNIAAGALLEFILEEVGPSIYNRAVKDVQDRMARTVSDLDMEVHQEEFPYWTRRGSSRAGLT